MVASKSAKKTSKNKGHFKQVSILILSGVMAFMLLALTTYNSNDPGLFHLDSNAAIHNKGGAVGAYLADTLYGFLGYVSFLIPIVFLVSVFHLFKMTHSDKKSSINLTITVVGVFVALVAGCGLATLLWPESGLIYKAGGLLGLGITKMTVRLFDVFGAIMILFSVFIAGVTLFADIQWLKVIDKIGESVLSLIDSTGDGAKTLPVKNAEKLKPFLESASPETATNKLPEDSVSMFGAVTSALSGLLSSGKRSLSGKLKPRESNSDQANDPLLEPSGGYRQAPVLGVPDYMSEENHGFTEPDIAIEPEKPQPPIKKIIQKAQKIKKIGAVHNPRKAAASRPISLDKAIALPPLSLLKPALSNQNSVTKSQLETHARNIIESLEHFGIPGVVIDSYYPGPIITRFELLLPPGTKVSKVTGLSRDMARNMCVSSIRVVEVIPGKTTIGIEVPNEKRDLVSISEIIDSDAFRNEKSPLTMVLGKTISGRPATVDLSRMPHLLIAGTTGSGKSVGVNAMLISLLYKAVPSEVKMILIDPKMLELSIYEGIPHLLTPVITDMKDAANGLRWAVGEMERRYALMSHIKVRNVAGYNEKVKEAIDKGSPIMDPTFDPTTQLDTRPKTLEPLPYIVIVIDEFADMMMVVGKKVEELIARLAQKARAAGIHLILATQRPSVDVITGLIKANIPTRIAFQVSTKIDSRTILDQGGAESLLGHGDMLYLPPGSGLPQRVHGAFVADEEVEEVVAYLKRQGEPEYVVGVTEETGSDAIPGLEPLADSESDVLYDTAVAIVTESRRASISYVQRRLKVGYNRAATMIEDMEQAGVVSAVQSNGTREVLAPEPVKN